MSFGNRSHFATLKDAYGILNFSNEEEQNYNIQVPEEKTIEKFSDEAPKVIETPEEIQITSCDMVKKHILSCNCMNNKYGPVGTWLNEILNICLICILIYILMYKPKI